MNKEQYISLIIAKLNGNINSQEEENLNNWLSINKENQLEFEEISKTWATADIYEPIINTDTDNLWAKIENKINEEETKVVSISKSYTWQKIAATVLILISTGFLLKTMLFNSTVIVESTAFNETKQVVLPDGSTIELNENSKVTFAKKFEKRIVSLEGEAFFDVTKDAKNPFSVKTKDIETFVLGTTFNINSREKENTKISLFTGKIKVVTESESLILKPGQKVTYYNKTKTIQKSDKDIENEIAWKTKKIVFNKTKLSQVFKTIEVVYGKKISLENKTSLECIFTGEFNHNEIEKLLKAISYTYETNYRIENNTIYFDSFECIK